MSDKRITQSITIRNLDPIKELEFEVKRFGLVIGESAVGKSTLAKAIFLFKNLKAQIMRRFMFYLTQKQIPTREKFNRWLVVEIDDSFNRLYNRSLTSCRELFLEYRWDIDKTITIQVDRETVQIESKNILSTLYSNFSDIYNSLSESVSEDKFDRASRLDIGWDIVPEMVDKVFGDTQRAYYIPANRNAIIDFASPIARVGADNVEYLAGEYFKQIETIKKLFGEGIGSIQNSNSPELREIGHTIRDILGGDYFSAGGVDNFELTDGTSIPLTALSSGQKDTLWLLYQLYYLICKKYDSYVIIEEPESHIFTSLQKKVVDVIAFFANQTNNGVLVTTHSPYILLAANTLYYAGHFTDKAEEAEKIVGKDMVIHENDLTAIQLQRSGPIDLIYPEEHELHTECIDAADEIHNNYSELVNLED